MWWRKDSRRLEEVEDELAKLKRDFAGLELEWINAYEKLKKIVQRISKQAEIVQRAESPAQPADGELNGTSSLSARQQEINQRILARRNRLGKAEVQ